MASVADALRMHAPGIMSSLATGQQKVLSLITRCRTGALGGVHYRATAVVENTGSDAVAVTVTAPACGHEKTQVWIEKQRAKLMPVHHFLVTFTVPRELGSVLRGNQREGYRCLFDSSAQSIRDVGAATKSLASCQLGFFGVLHTWGRDLQTYHPHVHFVVPGGGVKVDEHGRAVSWQSTAKNFLFHHGTLIRVYKAKLADELRAAGLYDLVPAGRLAQGLCRRHPAGRPRRADAEVSRSVRASCGDQRQTDRVSRRVIGDLHGSVRRSRSESITRDRRRR